MVTYNTNLVCNISLFVLVRQPQVCTQTSIPPIPAEKEERFAKRFLSLVVVDFVSIGWLWYARLGRARLEAGTSWEVLGSPRKSHFPPRIVVESW